MIVLGRIVAPYGVRGWVKVRPFGDDPGAWSGMAQWWLGNEPDGDAWQAYRLQGFRSQGAAWVAKLEGVDDRTGAEALDGAFVAAPREALPVTAADEYYWGDLVGLAVVDEQEEPLGRVAGLIETGAHPVLVVREGEGSGAVERLLPFVAAVVREVDVAAGRIRVSWARDW